MDCTIETDKLLNRITHFLNSNSLPGLAAVNKVLDSFSSAYYGSITELANVCLQDYALTTSILRVVNNSFYGLGGHVTTV